MCDTWLDGPRVWSSVTRTARKDHRCCACGETIPRGVAYRYSSGLWDEWADFKHCDGCWLVFVTLASRAEGPVDLELNCGERWQDVFDDPPPAPVVEAIFARPGEVGFEAKR